MPIPPAFSLYLDLVRFLAAVIVFLSHVGKPGIAPGAVPNLFRQGIDAVTVFFVLSGFVVSYAAETKDRTLPDYLCARLSRLWSVALPALLLSALLEYAGRSLAPGFYDLHATPDIFAGSDGLRQLIAGTPALRGLFGAAFLNEAFGLTIIQYYNAPFWSLGYEFWYYMLFAAVIYLRSWWRLAGIGAALLVMGPKIALLLPTWAVGVAIQRWRPQVPAPLAWTFLLLPGVAYLAASRLGGPGLVERFDVLLPDPSWSRYFVWQYGLSLFVAMNFVGAYSLARLDWLLPLARPIRFLAGRTLSLYLYHFPILYFLGAVWPDSPHPLLRGGAFIAITGTVVFALSSLTEARKGDWRAALQAISGGLRRRTA